MTNTLSNTLPSWLHIGFSGHRNLNNLTLIQDVLDEQISALIKDYGLLSGFSSTASGSDSLFLQMLSKREIPYRVVLPCPRSEFAQDFEEDQWEKNILLIDRAYDELIVPPMGTREDAYLEAGVLLVDDCDLLIAVWNGEEAAGTGGTGQIVDYARSRGLPLIIIDSETGELKRERIEQIEQPSQSVPDIAKNFSFLTKGDELRERVQAAYDTFDQYASSHGPWARILVVVIILLHLLASAIALSSETLSFFKDYALLTSMIKVSALIVALYLVLKHHEYQHKWIDTRPAAEVCRMFLAIWSLKREGSPVHESTFARHDSLIRNLVTAWRLDKKSVLPFEKAKDAYIDERVDDQLNYYRSKLKPAELLHDILRKTASSMTFLAIIAGSIALSEKLFHFLPSPTYTEWFKYSSIVLPLATTAILSSLLVVDYGRRATRYKVMISTLEAAKLTIDSAINWPSLWRAVSELEHDLLNEVEEWRSLTIFTGESH